MSANKDYHSALNQVFALNPYMMDVCALLLPQGQGGDGQLEKKKKKKKIRTDVKKKRKKKDKFPSETSISIIYTCHRK